MLVGVYIVMDDDFQDPIYADPALEELDEGLWSTVCELLQEAFEGEGPARGVIEHGEVLLGWRALLKFGISFVAIATEVRGPDLQTYLKLISERYLDEVDDVRQPDRHGVEDVVVDVIPPWDEG
ncbi:MAG TPA: hypothetical protein ENK18_10500 [Deltaproteobacteria bacterium]|nr:hypothetical protein [Deltaproteobacteria bacterium]